jgi:hypothetical protein
MLARSLRPAAALGLLASLTSLSGCYAFGLNARPYTKPVSLSGTLGRPVTPLRHFRRELIAWYFLGRWPIATLPGAPNPYTPADKLVLSVLEEELGREGDGVINLRVSQFVDWRTLLVAGVPAAAVDLIPGMPAWAGAALPLLFQPASVTLEGDVVRFAELGGAPAAEGACMRRAGRLDLGGWDLDAAIAAAR